MYLHVYSRLHVDSKVLSSKIVFVAPTWFSPNILLSRACNTVLIRVKPRSQWEVNDQWEGCIRSDWLMRGPDSPCCRWWRWWWSPPGSSPPARCTPAGSGACCTAGPGHKRCCGALLFLINTLLLFLINKYLDYISVAIVHVHGQQCRGHHLTSNMGWNISLIQHTERTKIVVSQLIIKYTFNVLVNRPLDTINWN